MRIANHELGMELGGVCLRLRPSLRSACHLEQQYGFEPLARAIAEGNISIMADVIQGATMGQAIERRQIESALFGSLQYLDAIAAQLLGFIFQLCGADDDPGPAHAAPSNPMPLGEFYAKLYRIGTGWLGWTPADTWSATPSELIEAYKGRTELLQAIFGAPGIDDQKGTFKPDLNAQLDRQGLEDLKALGRL